MVWFLFLSSLRMTPGLPEGVRVVLVIFPVLGLVPTCVPASSCFLVGRFFLFVLACDVVLVVLLACVAWFEFSVCFLGVRGGSFCFSAGA